MEHYQVESPNGMYVFGVTVHHMSDESRDIVWVGARKAWCVIISVYHSSDEDDNDEKEDNALAHIEGISYNNKCAAGDQMSRMVGTFQMVMSAIKFVMLKYEHITGFTLKDTSHMRCSDGKTIELSYLQSAMYGKTWYQHRFHAVPRDETTSRTLDTCWRWMTEPKTLGYDAFYHRWITPLRQRGIKSALRPFYMAAPNVRTFILTASRALGCQVMRGWTKSMLLETGVALDDFYWVIHTNTLPNTPNISFSERATPLFPPETTDVSQLFALIEQVESGDDRMWPFGKEPINMSEFDEM